MDAESASGPLGRGEIAQLAFWAKNMSAIRDGKIKWPGFSYTDPEWSRMQTLAAPISDGRYNLYLFVNAVIFIAVAALGIVGIWLPLANLLFPVPAETSALKFALLLAGYCLLALGVGLPVSLRIAAWWCATPEIGELPPAPPDRALRDKVAWQIGRITLIMCGVLVPGILVFIAYDIQAGPVITALKWAAIALMGLSIGGGMIRRRRGA